ncbi:hypothetical protein SDC9_192336 [bioreactor metagenome]|uniref:Uncharacterized protein n=1 Tax=bioreactor metagenome TaxID=1076179 RepID=A0A645I0F5_9ZZZZ
MGSVDLLPAQGSADRRSDELNLRLLGDRLRPGEHVAAGLVPFFEQRLDGHGGDVTFVDQWSGHLAEWPPHGIAIHDLRRPLLRVDCEAGRAQHRPFSDLGRHCVLNHRPEALWVILDRLRRQVDDTPHA